MHPTSRQNFGDGPGQTPKLILTLWHTTMLLLFSLLDILNFEYDDEQYDAYLNIITQGGEVENIYFIS